MSLLTSQCGDSGMVRMWHRPSTGVRLARPENVLQSRPRKGSSSGTRAPRLTISPAMQWVVVRIRGDVTSLMIDVSDPGAVVTRLT